MSRNHPFGWDLPAGVSHKDIDRHFGNDDEQFKTCPACDGTGKLNASESGEACPKCDGEGTVAMTPEEIEEEILDRRAEKADRLRDEEIDRQMGL
jgi:DnaJ-class molecular chaperone